MTNPEHQYFLQRTVIVHEHWSARDGYSQLYHDAHEQATDWTNATVIASRDDSCEDVILVVRLNRDDF